MTERSRTAGMNEWFSLYASAVEYIADAAHPTVLFADVMRERRNEYHQHMAKTAPHVLGYGAELVRLRLSGKC